MNLLRLVSILMIVGAISCGKDDPIEIQKDLPFTFEDGFESASNELDALFPADGSRWTGIQMVNPSDVENQIELDQTTVKEENTSLRIFSNPSDNTLSKMDIEKAGFFAPTGSKLSIEADFYINSDENLQDLFLIDLECCSCWDPSVSENQCPGVRLKLSDVNNYLSIERGKILGSTFSHEELSFPKKEWVNVIWEMELQSSDEGQNTLSINGQQVISEAGKNLPNKDEFRSEFEANGIEFELQEPLGYERVQIGATANPTDQEVEIFIDNFKLHIE